MDRVAALLSAYPGRAFCRECLASQLALDAAVTWRAAVHLGQLPEFEVDTGFCSSCLDQLEDVAHVRWLPVRQEPASEAPMKPRVRFTFRGPSEST